MPRRPESGGKCAAAALLWCVACAPDAPPAFVDTECDTPPTTMPLEVTSDPNVNIVIVDNAYPKVLDFNEVVIWDGRLAHQALAQRFFCHRPERMTLALEEPPGPHRVQILLRFRGNPDTPYAGLKFEVK